MTYLLQEKIYNVKILFFFISLSNKKYAIPLDIVSMKFRIQGNLWKSFLVSKLSTHNTWTSESLYPWHSSCPILPHRKPPVMTNTCIVKHIKKKLSNWFFLKSLIKYVTKPTDYLVWLNTKQLQFYTRELFSSQSYSVLCSRPEIFMKIQSNPEYRKQKVTVYKSYFCPV